MQVLLDNIGWGAIYSEYQVNIVLGISQQQSQFQIPYQSEYRLFLYRVGEYINMKEERLNEH
ncbi:hypothetical protein GCM10008915_77180 [Bifidobacterium pullorum subsp. gallinarum]